MHRLRSKKWAVLVAWTITEILPDSHPGDADRVSTTDPCSNR